MKKFEYKTIFMDVSKFYKWTGKVDFKSEEMETVLNDLGNEGWELVSTDSSNQMGTTQGVYLFFKRIRTF